MSVTTTQNIETINNLDVNPISDLLKTLGQPARVQILLALGDGEACVCHLEGVLGLRQAYLSQQLMALRDAGLVTTHREGRNIFYSLEKPETLDLLALAAQLAGLDALDLAIYQQTGYQCECSCPKCEKV